jgi:L-threonylcarbamoyladenylate synthase
VTAWPSTRVMTVTPEALANAVRCLRAGGLVAFPTETVYGLGTDATDGKAIARLYDAKGRPTFNPLIAHVHDAARARGLGIFDAVAARLAEAFWPGPLTLAVPRQPGCPVADLATAGLATIALRVPAHNVARDLLAAFGGPIVAPSANRSGHVSPTTAQHVLADLRGRIDLVLDGGPSLVGLESTIVACIGEPTLLRPGGLPRSDIERVLGHPLADGPPPIELTDSEEGPLAPGQLASHYAPRTPLRLNARTVGTDEALLAFGEPIPPGNDHVSILNLSPGADMIEAAANLFSYLRALDVLGASAIAVMPIPHNGLGEAINDRLQRAAAPRPDETPQQPRYKLHDPKDEHDV